MENKKKSKCITIIKWRNYKLSAWENHRKDGSTWLSYEIQRSIFLGKDKPEGQKYDNQALSLTKLEDLCYLKTIIKYIMARNNTNPINKYSFVCYKVINEEIKKSWKDEKKPTKEELKKALRLTHFFRTYKNKEGREQETKHLIVNSSELDITRDFIDHCIRNIESIYAGKVVMNDTSTYKDNVDYSQSNENSSGEFIDEQIDDEIPF